MNIEIIRTIIDFYIQNETRLHFNNLEVYKWNIFTSIREEIVRYVNLHYENGVWDEDYSDFSAFTRKTIGKTGNLVYSSSRSVMQKAADKYPKQVRKMFIELAGFGTQISLTDRISRFIKEIDTIAKENPDISKSGKSFHNDLRSVSVYLLMMNPEDNYNYMYSTFVSFAKFAEMSISKAGSVNLILEYYEVCDYIRNCLRENYREWFDLYIENQKDADENGDGITDIHGHLLTQDIVFSLYYYNHPEAIPSGDDIVEPIEFKKTPIRKIASPGKGVFVDYEAKRKSNNKVGAAAENFILENERRRVAKYGFSPDRVRHVSKEQGDGLGYDILSCDKDGRDIFIEVKGTRGGIGTGFYITDNELQCSLQHKEQYRLHRVYNFTISGTNGSGEIAEIKGSLEDYCNNPILYKAFF